MTLCIPKDASGVSNNLSPNIDRIVIKMSKHRSWVNDNTATKGSITFALIILGLLATLLVWSTACRGIDDSFEALTNSETTPNHTKVYRVRDLRFEIVKSPLTGLCYEFVGYTYSWDSTTSIQVDCKYYNDQQTYAPSQLEDRQ